MQISIILLGVLIIFINFFISKQSIKKFNINLMLINLASLLALAFLIIKPIYLFDTIYVSIGGFFILSSLAIYMLIKTKLEKDLSAISLGTILILGASLILNLIFPFSNEELFNVTTVLVGIIIGAMTFGVIKNIKNAFIIIFLSLPIASIISFTISRLNNINNLLFLGTGNFFEISMIAFFTAFIMFLINENISKVKEINSNQDVLTLNKEEIEEINENKGEENER